MGEINISTDELNAINSIDVNELRQLIDRAINNEQLGDLARLPLSRCGLYVSNLQHYFRLDFEKYLSAKSQKKREQTEYTLRRSGDKLVYAIYDLKQRVECEQKEGELFYINDRIVPPIFLNERLSVTVSYKWRQTADNEWKYGNVTFLHEVIFRPDYLTPPPRRKPSAAKTRQMRQEKLYQTWEYLMRSALCSVRDYFREGGDGDKIPEYYKVTSDKYNNSLNNYSTQFWRIQS